MLLQLILISVVVWVAFLRWTRRKKILCFQQFKNEVPSIPIVGHAYLFTGTGEAKMKGIQALGREAIKQGGVTVMQSWLLDAFYAMVADAEVAEVILRNCLEKDDSMKTLKSIFGNGLLVSDVPEWRLRRKTLNPAFTQKYLNQNVNIFQRNSSILAEKLKHISKTGPFSIYNYITPYALDSVFESIYAFEIGAQKNPQHPVMQALSVCCELVSNRLCLPWLHNQVVYEMTAQCATLKKNAELIFEFIDEKIVKKCKEFRSNADSKPEDLLSGKPKNTSKSMLQLMIETSSNANETLSDEYLREETFVVTFAGTDTTSVGLSFIFAMLARHPDVQERVHQEIMEVIGDAKKPVEAENLPQLKYTEAVIKETLRMYPPAPLMLRKVDKDISLPSGKYLAAGTGVMINIWAVHHNPKYWDEPEQFRPERFLDAKPRHPAAFLAFSYGVRNCIGAQYAMMSLKTSLSTLIRQYRVLPANDDPKAELPPLRTQMDVMMRDVDNFIVQLVPRL